MIVADVGSLYFFNTKGNDVIKKQCMQNYGFRDKSEKHSNKNNLDFLAIRLQSYCSLFKHRFFFFNEYFDERD